MEFAKYFIVGSASFWAPVVFAQMLGLDFALALIGTAIAPGSAVLAWRIFRKRKTRKHLDYSAIAMLFGIWIMGPPAMALGSMRSESTLFHVGFWGMWALFPITTWMLSAHFGSMLGLIIVSGYLLLEADKARRSPSSHSPERPTAR